MKYARDFRASARAALAGNWGLALGVGVVASLLGGGETGLLSASSDLNFDLNFDTDTESISSLENLLSELDSSAWAMLGAVAIVVLNVLLILSIVYFFLGSIISVGYARFNLNLIDNKAPAFTDLFSYFRYGGKIILANLLKTLFIVLWSLLFVIPGILAAYNYAMVPYILAEHPELSAKQALKESKDLMYGHRWRLFCLGISFIGWSFLCVLSCGVGYLWLTPYMQAATADFYREISGTYPVPEEPANEAGESSDFPHTEGI